jgi:hypothetical protein
MNLLRQLVIIAARLLPVFQINEILARIRICTTKFTDFYIQVFFFCDIGMQGNSKLYLALP